MSRTTTQSTRSSPLLENGSDSTNNTNASAQHPGTGTSQDPFLVTNDQPTPKLKYPGNGPNYSHDYQMKSVREWMSSLAMLSILKALVPHPMKYHIVEPLLTQPAKEFKHYQPRVESNAEHIIIPLYDYGRQHWMISIARCADGGVQIHDPDGKPVVSHWIEAVRSLLSVCRPVGSEMTWQRPIIGTVENSDADGRTCGHRCIQWVLCRIYGLSVGRGSVPIRFWSEALAVVIGCSSIDQAVDATIVTRTRTDCIEDDVDVALAMMEEDYLGTRALTLLARRIKYAREIEDDCRRKRYIENLAQIAVSFDCDVAEHDATELALEAAGRLLRPLDSRGAEALLRYSEHELERTQNALNGMALQAWQATERWQSQITRVRSRLSTMGMIVQRGDSAALRLIDGIDE